MRVFLSILLIPALAACSNPIRLGRNPPPQQTASGNPSLDATPAQREAARQATGGVSLGPTIASLGDPADPGLWLKTPLVRAARPGRVAVPGGASVGVELRPIPGPPTAGSRISLEAMRALGLQPTDLPKVEVYGL